MPAVDVAMQRSLRGGFVDLLIASLRPAITKRMDVATVQGQINDAKTAFSSWDNCMQASFCKWPVIAVIIVGGLIIFSVVWCIIRCACCGMSCCCSCFSCLKCCGDCCGCCDPPRGKRSKYLDEPYVPPNQGYKAPEPMMPFSPGATVPTHAMPPPVGVQTGVTPQYSAPQYAEFDVSKKGGEDALPAMPSWEGAESKKVMVEDDAVEMDQLKKPEVNSAQNLAGPAGAPGAPAAMGAAGAVGMGGRGPSPGLSPGNRSPYGPPGPGPAPGSKGYFPAPGMDNDPYAQQGQDYRQANDPYGPNQGMSQGQGYGMAVGGPIGQGRQSPRVGGYKNGPYGPPARQGSYDAYGNMPPPRQASPYRDDYNQQPMGNYNQPQRGDYNRTPVGDYNQQPMRGQGYGMGPGPGAGPRRSPPMQMGGGPGGYEPDQDYGGGYDDRPMPSREYSSESTRPLRAPPRRQYSHDVPDPTPPTVQDNGVGGGFDFGPAAYSRPIPNNNYRQPDPVMAEPQAPSQQGGGGAYPGYKAYQPGANSNNSQGW